MGSFSWKEKRRIEMGNMPSEGPGFFTSKLEAAVGWARKYSIFVYPFVTACCGMEYMSAASSHYEAAVGWARKYSIFVYPFVTACCGMEYMSAASSHYDMDRFGAGLPRFSPRQADVLLVVGTVSHKIAPILRRVYDQMCEPKWVVAFGVCTCTGGFYDNYATVQGIDTIVPVDIYIPGCPPRPEAVLDGLMKLQARIENQKQAL
jgi:NADH-quinone oxidoreductase subunit B